MTEATSLGLHSLLDEYAEERSSGLAYRFLADGEQDERLITYGELARRSRAIASGLSRQVQAGQPVLLILPPGIDFIAALFACWYAGVIAVPAYPPRGTRHRQRLEVVISDSRATLAIGLPGNHSVPGLQILELSTLEEDGLCLWQSFHEPETTDGPCLLQYTSGSTALPKGVMISHRNLRSHYAATKFYQEKLSLTSAVSWLPPYHDMGLVLKILYAFEAGMPLTFFSPDHFIQRPVRWLRAISRYQGSYSGGPNFAFEMCLRGIRDEDLTGLDLSSWKCAPCGAERVRAETLKRFHARFAPYGFRKEAFMPGYGMAETTLIATAHPGGQPPVISNHPIHGRLVSSGKALAHTELSITDPETGRLCEEGVTGEVRIGGAIVADGYWHREQETAAIFAPSGLHTGDLGYLESGQLFITGRIKDLIILNGENIAPDDIEQAIMKRLPNVAAAAAFPLESEGREAIGVALEIPSETRPAFDELCREVRIAVGEAMEVPLQGIFITRQGLLPRTTSGKIQRRAAKHAIAEGSLKLLHEETTSPVSIHGDHLKLLLESVEEVTGRTSVTPEDDVVGFGMSSIEVTRMAAVFHAKSGISLSHAKIFSARSLAELVEHPNNDQSRASAQIPARAEGAAIFLSHSQERMWFLYRMAPDSAAYHVYGALELTGSLDVDALDLAYQQVVARYAILRSRHADIDGKIRVKIDQGLPLGLALHKASTPQKMHAILADFARKPFKLESESPVRACLIDLGADRHALAICAHHIVADGWSIRILARELTAVYKAIAAGETVPSFPTPTAYADYAAWHRQWVDSGAVDEQIEYWKNRLADHPGIMNLETDFPRPLQPSSDGAMVECILPAELGNRISQLATVHRATPFMIQLAAFHLLLRHHGAGDDQVLAVPVANRNQAATGDLVGTLVNTLPFRMDIKADETFGDFLQRIRTASFEMQAAQDAPFERIIEAVKPDRARDHSPLAQVMIDHQELPLMDQWTDSLKCKPLLAHRGAAQFDLSLLLFVMNDRQQVVIEYRTDLFRPETAQALLARYVGLLETVTRLPHLTIREIGVTTAADLAQLERISAGPVRADFSANTTPALIAKRCGLHPQRIAATIDSETLSYGALDKRSSEYASGLRKAGVRKGDRVAILLERGFSLPLAILAIWKVGAAYVPLDSANPKERLARILEDQQPLTLLVSPSLAGNVPDGYSFILLDDSLKSDSASDAHIMPSDAAYVIYTSGSTGKPKGVVISHGSLANFLLSMAEKPGFTEADKLLAVTTISFDISTLEIFLPLIIGGSVEIVPSRDSKDGAKLLGKLKSSKSTVMQATPATWLLLINAGWKGSHYLKVLCGGEAMDLTFAQQLRSLCGQLWNMYGPTETTVWSTLWQVPKDPQHIRIGEPIANTGCHIVAGDRSLLPPGVSGELWISGDGLADGYWERPDLTESRFVTLNDSTRAYRTGDLARWHADGALECLGRNDRQVKIRGFRVELGEIESILMTHPQVTSAKVALRNERLLAWVVPSNGDPLDLSEIRNHIGNRLPVYMLPSAIGVIEAFPLNSNGKLDVQQLPDPAAIPTNKMEAPLTDTEIRLSALWWELLGAVVIHRNDDWFHLGGHSLLAMRLFARIHSDFQRALPLSSILDHTTLRQLAELIDQTAVNEE